MRALNNARTFFSPIHFIGGISLWLLLAIAYFIYLPGVAEGFLFDDYININEIGNSGTVDSWNKVLQLILTADAGPSGRPISIASFLLNDNTWPSSATSFKYTNVLLHLLCGVAIAWLFYLVLQSLNWKQKSALIICVVAATLWLVHPLHVSTVLYPVQRMTILAAIFVVLGLIFYVKGRLTLSEGKSPVKAFSYMFVGIGVCTPLAILSKENGGLLPLLALALDITVLNQLSTPFWQNKRLKLFRVIFIYVPIISIFGYFAINWENRILDSYVKRPFTLSERLLTEARIIFDYINNLLIPRMQSSGLYYDNYLISKDLTDPPTTLLAIISIFLLLIFAFFVEKSRPILALSILFFFFAHIIESSFIALELYFEHRNYLPSIFIFLAIAAGLFYISEKTNNKRIVPVVMVSLLIIFSGMTYARTNLWSDIDRLALVWAQENPGSLRTQQHAAIVWNKVGHTEKAVQHMQQAIENSPDRLVLHLQKISLFCENDKFSAEEKETILVKARSLLMEKYAGDTLQRIIRQKNKGQCPSIRYEYIEDVLHAAKKNKSNINISGIKQQLYYLLGQIYLHQNKEEEAEKAFFEAYKAMPESMDAGFQIIAVMATYGQYAPALRLLDLMESNINNLSNSFGKKSLIASVRDYDGEIIRIRKQLAKDLAEKNSMTGKKND